MNDLRDKLTEMYGVSDHSMVASRRALGACVVFDILDRTGLLSGYPRDAFTFYSEYALEPRSDVMAQTAFSLFMATGEMTIVWMLFAIGASAGVCLMLGAAPRQAAFVSLLVQFGAAKRAPSSYMGADTVLARSLFFLALDPALPLQKVHQPQANTTLCPGGVMLLVQQGLAYLCAGLSKSRDAWLYSRFAVLEVLRSPFGRDHIANRWLLQSTTLLNCAPVAVVFAELLAVSLHPSHERTVNFDDPLLFSTQAFIERTPSIHAWQGVLILLPVLSPRTSRCVGAFVVLALQLGMGTCMHLGLFPLVMCATILPVFPPSIWQATPKPRPDVTGVAPVRNVAVSGWADIACRGLCWVLLAYILVTTPWAFPCAADASADSLACELPLALRSSSSSPVNHAVSLVASTLGVRANAIDFRGLHLLIGSFGFTPFAFDMFYIPRRDHGWMVALAREQATGQVVSLPRGAVVRSATEAFSRPEPSSFPSLRWRQFWFTMADPTTKSEKLRHQFAGHFCRFPPYANRSFDQVQLFWFGPDIRADDWMAPPLNYPAIQSTRLLNWFCSMELYEQYAAGKCSHCEDALIQASSDEKSSKGSDTTSRGAKEEL